MFPTRTPLAVLLSLAGVTACAKGGDSGATTDTAAVASAAAPQMAAAPNVVNVTATNYKFDAPDQIPSGMTTIHLVDDGSEAHHVQLVKLTDGKTTTDLAAALKKPGPLPSWAVTVGGPNTPRPGGGIAEATLALEPGNYAMLCFIPSPDGVPHFAKGMMRPLTVTAASAPMAPEPTADITVKLVDYDFQFSTPVTTGRHTLSLQTAATQPHEMFIVRLPAGKTVKDFAAWTEKMQGPPPGEPLGGATFINPGGTNYVTMDFTPGEYGLICFVPDAKDGKPHFLHGMMKQFTVS